jgi:glycosyltransferase involved in cell wall biosynthesis
MDHVYLYIHDFRSSGVVRNALSYARRLAREHPTTLIAGYGGGLFRAEAEQGPFALVVLSEKQGQTSRRAAFPRLRKWLRKQPPGVLLSMGVYGHPTVFAAVQRLSHIRRVYRFSNEVAGAVKGDGRLRRLWLWLLMRDAARVALVGRAMAEHRVFAAALADGTAVSIPNGVDREGAKLLAQVPSPHPWLVTRIPVIVAVGRLRPQKNLDLLIQAVALARKTKRMRLIILGSGTPEERARLQSLAADFSNDFLLAGETENVFAWIARADVFALPSRWEGSALALLEAMAVGTPVIASRLAGDAVQVLEDGRHGLLCDGDDVLQWRDALLRQLSEQRVLPGDRADDFSIARTADLYAELVRDAFADGIRVSRLRSRLRAGSGRDSCTA